MDTLVTTSLFTEALDLCERGKTHEALALLPEIPDGPYRWMVEGAALAFTEPEKAKNLLSKAADGLTGDLRDKAVIWLSCCYWVIGEENEAKITLSAVKPELAETTFIWTVTKSVYESANVPYAMSLLDGVRDEAETAKHLPRGKFFVQRGYLLRRLGRPDEAIIAYQEAIYWLDQADCPSRSARAVNNLAAILADQNEFDEAHRVVDGAIQSLSRLGENVYLAQAHDQKAQIFLAQQKFVEAGNTAPKSTTLLENREQRQYLAESLITEAKALIKTGKYLESFRRLDRALKIGEYLNNASVIFDAAWVQRDLADKIRRSAEYQLIKIAYEGNSLRGGAKKMGTRHSAFRKLIIKHGLERTPKRPTRRILNARKK